MLEPALTNAQGEAVVGAKDLMDLIVQEQKKINIHNPGYYNVYQQAQGSKQGVSSALKGVRRKLTHPTKAKAPPAAIETRLAGFLLGRGDKITVKERTLVMKAWEVGLAARRKNIPSVELVKLMIANVKKVSWKVIKEMEKEKAKAKTSSSHKA